MSESVTIEDARRAESRARAAADLVVGNELLPGPVPLPDFAFLMGRGKRWKRRAWILATGGSMAAVAAAAVIMLSEPAPISYVVDGAVAIADGIIDASGEAGQDQQDGQDGQDGQDQTDPAVASVHFSEGTEVALAPGARLRVVGRNAHGAALALDRGRARFAVTHRSGAHWSVATGPFSVDVIGTRFTLDWSPRDERLVVDLTAGSVLVRGASVGGPVAMHPGERLIATAADRRVTLSPLVEAQTLPGPLGVDGQGNGTEAADQVGSTDGSAGVSGMGAEDEPAVGALSTLAAERDRRTAVRTGGSRSSGGRLSLRSSGGGGGGGDGGANNSGGPGRFSPRRLSRHMDLAMVTPSRDLPAHALPPADPVRSPAVPAEPSAPPATAPVIDAREPQFVPEVMPHTLTLGGGGVACTRESAQYRFERAESGMSVPDLYTLAFSGPRPDRTHSWCGQSSLRVDANFNDAGRRNFFGRFAKETGQVVIKLHRSTDFTGRTVTVHFFVDGPADASFTAELVVVNRGRWVSGPPSGQLVAGRWWTISHKFDAENEAGVPGSSNPGPFPVGGTSPVTDVDRLGLAIHSTGGRRVWTGAVYVDDVGWR